MLVYGDPGFRAPLGELTERLAQGIRSAQRLTTSHFDVLRRLLIEAGQIEQAAEDAGIDGEILRRVTDRLAEAFVAWQESAEGDELPDALETAAAELMGATLPREADVRVAVPEGFA